MSKLRLDKRKDVPVKQESLDTRRRKSLTQLTALYDKFYNARKAEGRAEGTLQTYESSFRLLWLFLEARGLDDHVDTMDSDRYREFIIWMQEEYIKNDGHKYKPDEAKTVGLASRTIYDIIKVIKSFLFVHR